VPQFVVFGFDDNGISGLDGSGTTGGVRFVVDLFAGRTNPPGAGNPRTYDGTRALTSFYVATRYIAAAETDAPEHVKRAWRQAADAGHEIGLHSHSHPHGAAFTTDRWGAEIAACRGWLEKPFAAEAAAASDAGIGLARQEVTGFRTPFLEHGRPLFPALRLAGVTYDCSIEEGFAPGVDAGNPFWPYLVAPGYGGPQAADRELWEIPVYALIVPPDEECPRYGVPPGLRERLHDVRDYFDPADGKITGFDWNLWVEFGMTGPEVVATVRYTLDRRLAGNRAPLTLGTHSDLYSEQYPGDLPTTAAERRQALVEILDDALARPEVRVVTNRQLVDWLRAPAAL
jgi:peptidoglycan/xylan/chitin deacetylase (PgdA/CDA1 family)